MLMLLIMILIFPEREVAPKDQEYDHDQEDE
jgi:hypothetical protein